MSTHPWTCPDCGASVTGENGICPRCGSASAGDAGGLSAPSGLSSFVEPTAPTPPAPVTPPGWLGDTASPLEGLTAPPLAPVEADRAEVSGGASASAQAPVVPPRTATRPPAAVRPTEATGAAVTAKAPIDHRRHARRTPRDPNAAGGETQRRIRAATRDWERRSQGSRWRGVKIILITFAVLFIVPLLLLRLDSARTSGEVTVADQVTVYDENATHGVKAADYVRLRSLLDEVMQVNRDLPEYVEESLLDPADTAAGLGVELRRWNKAHPGADGETKELARAGAAFAVALAAWVSAPDAEGTYDAYVAAWREWDAADDTWESE